MHDLVGKWREMKRGNVPRFPILKITCINLDVKATCIVSYAACRFNLG
jgi:hypothetical protein